jgi:hypothetical protein
MPAMLSRAGHITCAKCSFFGVVTQIEMVTVTVSETVEEARRSASSVQARPALRLRQPAPSEAASRMRFSLSCGVHHSSPSSSKKRSTGSSHTISSRQRR